MTENRLRYASPLGEILIAADSHALTGLWFVDQKYAPTEFIQSEKPESSRVLRATTKWLDQYFVNKRGTMRSLPEVKPSGTDFQRSVWTALLGISAGQTVTYTELAERIKRPSAVRAVAAAVGRNPISILIPCHRVIGANGSLTGYAGGLERKEALLTLENAPIMQRQLV